MNGVGGFKEVVMVSGQLYILSLLRIRSPCATPRDRKSWLCPHFNCGSSAMPEVEEVEYDIDPKDLHVDITTH